jgi:hypothetical protein
MTSPKNILDRQYQHEGARHCHQLWGTRSAIVLSTSEFKRHKNKAIRNKKKNNLRSKKKRTVDKVDSEIKTIKVPKKFNKNKRGRERKRSKR